MKVAKRFRWEGAHRLPWHCGGCKNLHGHSYIMWVELKGEPDEKGLLIDFKDIKKVLQPLIDQWDHAVLIAESDTDLLKAAEMLQSDYFILPYDTTSENMCQFVAEYLAKNALDLLVQHKIDSVSIKLQETETCYAEHEATLEEMKAMRKVSAELISE